MHGDYIYNDFCIAYKKCKKGRGATNIMEKRLQKWYKILFISTFVRINLTNQNENLTDTNQH